MLACNILLSRDPRNSTTNVQARKLTNSKPVLSVDLPEGTRLINQTFTHAANICFDFIVFYNVERNKY
jgi:hypothetical protein